MRGFAGYRLGVLTAGGERCLAGHVGARRICLLALLAAALLPASARAADGEYTRVTVDPPSRPQEAGSDQYLVGTPTPTFHIRLDHNPPDGYQLYCHVDTDAAAPCGTQDAQCPVAQCWTYT